MLIKNSKGTVIEVSEEQWERLRQHGFSSWEVVRNTTKEPVQTKVEKRKAEKIELPKLEIKEQ